MMSLPVSECAVERGTETARGFFYRLLSGVLMAQLGHKAVYRALHIKGHDLLLSRTENAHHKPQIQEEQNAADSRH